MKTLIINGSPHLNGNTCALTKLLLSEISGEHKLINAYYADAAPCTDCRRCQKTAVCAVKDGMTEIYDYIDVCDSVVIASPIYFGELTPPVLSIGSRLQAYYCGNKLSKAEQSSSHKKGGIILTGGGSSSGENAVKTAKILLKQMGAKEIFNPVCSLNTDKMSVLEDREAMGKISELAKYLNNV
ncbi:MAG: flavodoxin family protein [Firmicutes bacterium]|nr:flavodoxin family protein [[Eubacterium] siraeum]MCM1488689.1 flavodoxin family protein [Bacillota bacterium]